MADLPALPADEYRAAAFSKNTVRAYRADMEDFLAWLRERGVETPGSSDVAAYLASLPRRGLKVSTVRRRAATLGKAFGFSVPPRVNVNIGGGKGGTGRTGVKRRREDADVHEDEWEDVDGASDRNEGGRNAPRRRGKDRRIETLGRKKVDKEVYRKSIQKQGPQGQWSR